MNDSVIRKKILGTWICTHKDTPHTITYNSDGTIQIIMTINNYFNIIQIGGAIHKFFSGDTCKGNYSVNNGVVTLNLETVPKSWLNTRIAGINLSFGDIIVKFYGALLTASGGSKLKVLSISEKRMRLGHYYDPKEVIFEFEKS